MEILLIRHGQSQADLEDRHEGRADFPLTELGHRQAMMAAEWLKEHYRPELVIASPLQRASKTASIIGEITQAPVDFDPALMEWDNGLLAGLRKDEAAVRFPLPDGGRKPHDTLADTESLIAFRARAETFWSRFMKDYVEPQRYKRVALVSHGGMINMLFRSFLALPMDNDVMFSTGDTGIHLLSITPKGRRIVFVNRLEHLEIDSRNKK